MDVMHPPSQEQVSQVLLGILRCHIHIEPWGLGHKDAPRAIDGHCKHVPRGQALAEAARATTELKDQRSRALELGEFDDTSAPGYISFILTVLRDGVRDSLRTAWWRKSRRPWVILMYVS